MLGLSRRQETLVNLAGEVVHDLRNILQCLLSHTESALLCKSKNDPDFNMLSDMESLIIKGRELSERFLAYDKGLNSKPVGLDYNVIIRSLITHLKPQIPPTISVACELEENLRMIMGDSVLCEQMLMNLCLNGISAMPDGGRLFLRTENIDIVEPKQISGEVTIPPGEYVGLSVQDDGIGIAEEQLSRIFERFYTTKGQGKGTGLGLTVVKSVIDSLGGYISCQSRIGGSTLFQLFVPACRGDHRLAAANHRQRNTSATCSKPLILVIDDEQAILKFMELLLDNFGFRVVTALNEEEALKAFAHFEPDLVILDVGIPGKGGLTLFKEMQEITPGTKTLLVSGYPVDFSHIDQRYLHVVDFLAKPFTQQELLEQIEVSLRS